LQHISVTVSLVWLVITSVGEAPAHVPPEACLPLCSRLESLPQSAHWAKLPSLSRDCLYAAIQALLLPAHGSCVVEHVVGCLFTHVHVVYQDVQVGH